MNSFERKELKHMEESRDNWKHKAKERREQVRQLKRTIRDLIASRDSVEREILFTQKSSYETVSRSCFKDCFIEIADPKKGRKSMRIVQSRKNYKSPQRKLLTFFEKSRNQWKAKCRKAKAQVKYLKNRVRILEHSREQWKQRAQVLKTELERIQTEAKSRPNVKTSPSRPSRVVFIEIAYTKRKPRNAAL